MSGFSVWHFVAFVIFCVVILVPVSNILRRAGWSAWLSILWVVPGVNIVMLWAFAFSPWPNLPDQSR